jgi:CelD/BcsL family acetyltransferase involved in cellulose biosynthesis
VNAVGEVRPEGARSMPLKFEIGARTLFTVRRALQRVPLSLADARSGALPALPALPRAADGYSITSLPEALVSEAIARSGGMLPFVRQRYTRYYLDFAPGFEAWFAGLSSSTRQGLRRKAKKIAAESGGELDVRSFRAPAELELFHQVARRISLRTYQERLLGSGLPDTPEFLAEMLALAAMDQVRAWLLYIGAEPVAYLYCPAVGDTLLYAYLGHDPAFNDWSPGAVLQLRAMQEIFDERRFAWFDFTEGEGQHKRQLASGGVACVDLLLLRPTSANRFAVAALGGFNRAVAGAKRAVHNAGLAGLAKRLRRG